MTDAGPVADGCAAAVDAAVPVVCAALPLLLLLLKNHMEKHCLYCQCSGLRDNRFVGLVMKTMMKKMEA